jgi:two-component system chemotaxis response regulator CheY
MGNVIADQLDGLVNFCKQQMEMVKVASVLIVEDDSCVHDLLTRFLEIRGYSIAGNAFNGAEAVDIFINLIPKPNLILMDYRMPVMNGIEATRKIIEIEPSAQILFLSADSRVKDEAIEAGACGFLRKPVSCSEIITTIDKLISFLESERLVSTPTM